MRVDAYTAIGQVYNNDTRYKAASKGNSYGSDKVEISSMGKDYQTAKAAVAQASDVREDKMAEIKARMAAGTYNVSGMDFANKIVEGYSAGIVL